MVRISDSYFRVWASRFVRGLVSEPCPRFLFRPPQRDEVELSATTVFFEEWMTEVVSGFSLKLVTFVSAGFNFPVDKTPERSTPS